MTHPTRGTVNLTGGPFTLTVAISDVTNLGGFQLGVNYDPAIISPTQVSLGAFLSGGERTFAPVGPGYTAGRVNFGAFSFGAGVGPVGAGPVVHMTFLPVAEGTSPATLGDVLLTDAGAGSIRSR